MELTEDQKQAILACEAEVLEVLKKHDCHLEGAAILRPGNVDVQVVIAINPPEAAAAPEEAK